MERRIELLQKITKLEEDFNSLRDQYTTTLNRTHFMTNDDACNETCQLQCLVAKNIAKTFLNYLTNRVESQLPTAKNIRNRAE